MRHWLQLATRNWRVSPGRSFAIIFAIAIGVGTVIAVTSIYATVEATIAEQIVENWLGKSHITVESPIGHWGNVQQDLADQIAQTAGVSTVTPRFKTRMAIALTPQSDYIPQGVYSGRDNRIDVDIVGIDPHSEYLFRSYSKVDGRTIADSDNHAIVLDRRLADDLNLSIGDTVELEAYPGDPLCEFTIVGLIPGRRVAFFQSPTCYISLADVQQMRRDLNKVSAIDAIVDHPQPEFIEDVAGRIRRLIQDRRQNYLVTTATARLNQLTEAQRATRLVLLLFTFVAMLTSFFIILTTMSMGMMERVHLLGTMRCVGMTRLQLALLVFVELIPLGILGIILGLPAGLAMIRLGMMFIPYVGDLLQTVDLCAWGIKLAAAGGLVTTLVGAVAILHEGANVSPLKAVNSEAGSERTGMVILAGAIGALFVLVHYLMVRYVGDVLWFNPLVAFCAAATLNGGYALLAPCIVLLVAAPAVSLVAPLVGLHPKLAQDQVGRAPWRSAGICWTLMVGLSLIVFFSVRGESITRAWDFPAKLAGTFVWTPVPVPRAIVDKVAAMPGVVDTTAVNDVRCKVKSRKTSLLSMLSSESIFAASNPETFLSMAKLEFLQGDLQDAEAKLRRGGYILLTPEASHSFGYNLRDKVPVTIAGKTVEFEVAGVVRSPAMDIAVTYFQADSYMMLASASSVLGTLDDLAHYFDMDAVRMFLMNIQLPESPPPADFANSKPPARSSDRVVAQHVLNWLNHLPLEQERLAAVREELQQWHTGETARPSPGLARQLRRYQRALAEVSRQWADIDPAARWEIFRERLVLEAVKDFMARPHAQTGSLRRLKQDIDRDVRLATLIVSAIPAISLLVATLGIANLMTVNVNSRARQLATLRAVGATKSQIARLVVSEAMVLGLLGSVVGVVLGLHSASSANELTSRLIGIDIPWAVPWQRVAIAIALTWMICLAAGIPPALRAARSNVIAALRTGA